MSFSIKNAAWPTFHTSLLPLLGTAAFFAVATSFPLHQRSLRAAEEPAEANRSTAGGVAAQTGQTQQIEAERKSILRRSAISASLAEHTPSSLIIARITNALPAGMSLLNFSIDSSDNGAHVSVSALPVNPQQAMQFVRALQRQSSFINVRINSGNPLQKPAGAVTVEMILKSEVPDLLPIGTSTTASAIKPLAIEPGSAAK